MQGYISCHVRVFSYPSPTRSVCRDIVVVMCVCLFVCSCAHYNIISRESRSITFNFSKWPTVACSVESCSSFPQSSRRTTGFIRGFIEACKLCFNCFDVSKFLFAASF